MPRLPLGYCQGSAGTELMFVPPSYSHAGIVESYISYLRRKIDPYSSEPLIQTKRGFGYMLKAGKSA